ncbi:MAG TPA: ABC transporter ATP-binding protein [Tepidisphaeraceae bacterium]|jgi:ATP-binding cassette subfamily B protein|nr:ABC transporter ATP-binding protein [Tepidisphaeraceae bacterium]
MASDPSSNGTAPAIVPAPGGLIFLRLWRLLGPWKWWIALGVVMLLAAMPADLFPGLIWLYVTDDIILHWHGKPTPVLSTLVSLGGHVHGALRLLLSATVWLLVVYLIGETLETLSGYIMSRVAQQFIRDLRNRVYQKLQEQSLGYLQRQRIGDLISRAVGDVDELQSFIVGGIDVILGEGMLWLATVALVLLLNWKVASISLVPLIAVFFLLRYFNKKVKSIYAEARVKASEVTSRLQENLAGVVVIKIFGREAEEARRFHDATRAYYDRQMDAVYARSVFFPFTRAVGFLSNVFMVGVGGYSILTGGAFTPGDLIAFRAYWWRLFGPVQSLARVDDMVQRATASARRVFEVLDAPDELPDDPSATPVEKVRGGLALRGVSFHYPAELDGKQSLPVLHDITLEISPGQTAALCGPSGAGKSTVLNLLLRFYDPTDGQVQLDGRDLRTITRQSLSRCFALVQQESFLFNDSILDNIRYGRPGASEEQVIAAARAANAHDFISRFPSGYRTMVGERGVRLSGGQKQRISIARAFLANPAVLLLDEPTSSVEPDSEAAIIAALDRLMAGRTTVLTSHRPSLINQADIVYVIDEGKIIEQGKPSDLIESSGWFARFMRSGDESESTVVGR